MKYMLMVCVDENVNLTPDEVAAGDRLLTAWLDDTIGRGGIRTAAACGRSARLPRCSCAAARCW